MPDDQTGKPQEELPWQWDEGARRQVPQTGAVER